MAIDQRFVFYLLLFFILKLGCVIKITNIFVRQDHIHFCDTKMNVADVIRHVEIKMTELSIYLLHTAGIREIRVCVKCSLFVFTRQYLWALTCLVLAWIGFLPHVLLLCSKHGRVFSHVLTAHKLQLKWYYLILNWLSDEIKFMRWSVEGYSTL